MRRKHRSVAFALVTAAAMLTPATAVALPGDGGGEENESGYTVEVDVMYSGDAAPEGGGVFTEYVAPLCYWGPFRGSAGGPDVGDGTDMQKVLDFIEWGWTRPHAEGYGWVRWYGPIERFEDAVEREADGEKLIWYSLNCNIPLTDERAIAFAGGEVMGSAIVAGLGIQGETPEILIDPEVLAEAARDQMVIESPDVDRNPQGAGALGGATLVNVPTWFWVTNPEESVGGVDGERTIRADVVGGSVWAEVTAQTGGLSVGSPAGSTFCEPSVAITEWSPGSDDNAGCTVSFSRASIGYLGGYPVTTSTEWTATWEGMTQDGEAVGGDLAPLQRSETVNVPVAESQATVR
jgi:hypothetical protein